jgi:ABC-type sugar transport system ATPase subunit
MSAIDLTGLTKSYGTTPILHGIDLAIEEGEFVVFVGPSGCGKSTLLKLIAGLEPVTGGLIRIGGQVVNDVPPGKRDLAMVFQSYALYPHMTVRDNLGFGLRMSKLPPAAIATRIAETARILRLEMLLDRYPRALSGGQRQRVAIGRAIARRPKVLLFDEPLSNLDAELRGQTRVEIAKLHKTLGATIIYVTHDQVEAMTLADRIVLLHNGRVEQVGTPLDLYHRPANLFVARFIGAPGINLIKADGAMLGVRPEHLRLQAKGTGQLQAEVDVVEHLGDVMIVHLVATGGQRLAAKLDASRVVTAGEHFGLDWDHAHALSFNAEGRRVDRTALPELA